MRVVKLPKYYSWIILFFASLNVIFLGGKRRAFGIFIAEFHNEVFRNTSLAELNWIGDSYAAFGYITTTISTALILSTGKRYGLFQLLGSVFVLLACLASAYVSHARQLFFTHTVLHGIGSSLILSTVGLVVNEHFDKKHRFHILATTLVSGGSVASIVFIQFYAYLIEDFGWRKAFIILGCLYFVINGSASLIFVKKPDSTTDNDTSDMKKKKVCSLAFCRDDSITKKHIPLLILWTVDRMMTSIVTYGMLLNLADYMRRKQSSLQNSTSLSVMFAGGEALTYLIGAFITGLTKDLLRDRLKYVLLSCTGVMAASLIMWEFLADYTSFSHLLAAVSGLCLGPSITFLFPAGEELTLLPGHLAYPFSLAGMGLGMLTSPFLSAIIATTFEYRGFFLVQGCIILVKFACLFILCVRTRAIISSQAADSNNSYHYSKLITSDDDLHDTENGEVQATTDFVNRRSPDTVNVRVR